MPPKRALGVDGDRLSTLVAQMPASPTGDDLMKFFRTVADVVAEFNQQKQRRLTASHTSKTCKVAILTVG